MENTPNENRLRIAELFHEHGVYGYTQVLLQGTYEEITKAICTDTLPKECINALIGLETLDSEHQS